MGGVAPMALLIAPAADRCRRAAARHGRWRRLDCRGADSGLCPRFACRRCHCALAADCRADFAAPEPPSKRATAKFTDAPLLLFGLSGAVGAVIGARLTPLVPSPILLLLVRGLIVHRGLEDVARRRERRSRLRQRMPHRALRFCGLGRRHSDRISGRWRRLSAGARAAPLRPPDHEIGDGNFAGHHRFQFGRGLCGALGNCARVVAPRRCADCRRAAGIMGRLELRRTRSGPRFGKDFRGVSHWRWRRIWLLPTCPPRFKSSLKKEKSCYWKL